MSASRSARRYAKAVYLLAREKGEESVWDQDLSQAAEIVSNPEMASLMEHPKIGGAAKWRVFESTWSAQKRPLRTETGNLVKILLERQKITLLGAIVEAFRQLWEADKGILAVQVTTAIPLHPKEEAALTEKLARSLGKSVRIQSVVDPSIIGGAVLQIGDRMVDGSLRAKLAQLRESMVA